MSNGYIDKAEVEAILSGGQPAVNKFVVETVIQLKHGQERQHGLLESHYLEADERDRRIEAIDKWRKDQTQNCVARVKALIAEEHQVVHEKHMAEAHPIPRRVGDPDDADYSGDRRVWMMWQIGSKVSYVLLAVIISVLNIAIHYVIMGEP